MTTAELTLPNHSLPTADPRLDAIRAKVERGERLSLDDGMVLYETPDLWGVFELADLVRDRPQRVDVEAVDSPPGHELHA